MSLCACHSASPRDWALSAYDSIADIAERDWHELDPATAAGSFSSYGWLKATWGGDGFRFAAVVLRDDGGRVAAAC